MAIRTSNLSVRKHTLEAAKEHTTVQGEVVYAANMLHDQFFRSFVIALSLERPDELGAELRFFDHALSIWHVVQSDSSQRDMAFTALSTVPAKLKLAPALNRLKWAKNKSTKLSEYRNLIAHSGIYFRGYQAGKKIKFAPNFGDHGTRPSHRKRLEMINSLRFWHRLRNDILNLADYVGAVNDQIRRMDCAARGAELVGVPNTWPDRPRLPSWLHLQKIEKKLTPAVPQSKRRNPRRPSQK